MGIELVLDQDDRLGLGVGNVHEVLEAARPVEAGALGADQARRQPRHGSVTRKMFAPPPRADSGSCLAG